MAYTKYSLTPSNNTATPPDGAPEGMLPSAVNDTMRDMMAQIRDCGDGIRDGTYTMTAPKITGGTITGVAFTGNTFTSPVISGGSINNTPIGASTANTGAFTTLSATGATTFSGATVVSGSLTANTFSSSGATITGGTINGTAIGGSTASTGAFTTLSASGVATFSAGTVSAPAITTSGDTNTGIFFPAADTIAFTEGGVESMRIDSSGNVNVGITASLWGKQTIYNVSAVDTQSSLVLAGGTYNTGNQGGSISFTNRNAVDSTTSPLNLGARIRSGLNSLSSSQETAYLAFDTNNGSNLTERMRITNAGDVGIGTSSPATKLDVSGVVRYGNGSTSIGQLSFGSSLVTLEANSANTSLGLYASGTGSLQLFTNAAERMRIDSSGMLGLGITPAQTSGIAIELGGSANNNAINFLNSSNVQGWITSNAYYNGTNWLRKYGSGTTCTSYATNVSGDHVWYTAGASTAGSTISWSERMRIDSSGNLLVGTTSATLSSSYNFVSSQNSGFFRTTATANNNTAILCARNGNNGNVAEWWYDNSTSPGKVSITSTTTTYATSSDYRLKENIAPMTGALDKVSQLKPVTYKWKIDGSAGQGFIAHELQEVVPDAVSGEKDAVDKDGNPEYQGVDTSFLVATLTSAIQELHEIVKAQAAEIALLKSK